MPKIPYKVENTNEDEDYEIVSFEDFCDKSPNSNKKDALTLNDNINYRLYYESDPNSALRDGEKEDELKETSLNGKSVSWKRRNSGGFAPFGRYNQRNGAGKSGLFSSVIPKAKNEGESSREHRYQRFSGHRGLCERLPSIGPTLMVVCVVIILSVCVWWAVCGAVGGAWGDDHYRRLWERAHPHEASPPGLEDQVPPAPPSAPYAHEKVWQVLPEFRYHDHNNLSTKNKNNASESAKKKTEKKHNADRPVVEMKDMCADIDIDDNMRFDCYPQSDASEENCTSRGCCWNGNKTGIPYCFYPPDYDTYRFLNMTENMHSMVVYYEQLRSSGYPGEFKTVKMSFKYLSNDILQIKITDADNKRFETPYPEIPMITGPINNLQYRVMVESSKIGFKVVRLADNVTILNSQNIGGLILSDKFLQFSTLLPGNKIYGLGERQSRFQLDMNWKLYSIFNFDTAPRENTNLYGSHPFYLNVEDSGQSHGMLLLNSHAMDVILQPTPAITYRTIGGVINLFVMFGPSPASVVSQYTDIIGRPFMPPYWSLGFHLCKFNYGSLNVTHDVWQRNRDAEIPFDVQWNDLDYMNNSNDFTYDHLNYSGLPKFVEQLHSVGMHYIPLLDPGVSAAEKPGSYPPFDRGLELDIFIKNSSLQPFVGKVWNKVSTVWPDFTHPNSTTYWVDMLKMLHQQIPFDGAWIDMNEPSNFLSGPINGKCESEDLPYMPHISGGNALNFKTLCMEARHYAGKHYDLHNLYSLTEAIATNFALKEVRGKRAFIISRSTFVGSGHVAGHWSGDISSSWHDMAMTIPALLSFSLFGIPMMGADICGFNGNATTLLCKRWMQLGAFYPFSRNHNSIDSTPQDPASLGPDVVAASRRALRLRYTLLPYYYTLFWKAHTNGETVVRPLFFEFPQDSFAYTEDTQFMIGKYLLVVPLLTADETRTALLPSAAWFNILDGKSFRSNVTITEKSTVLVREGAILPMQKPLDSGPVTTENTRSCPLQLLAIPDKDRLATGGLYWDDGDSLNSYEEKKYSHITFKLKDQNLLSFVEWWGSGVPSLDTITLYSIEYKTNTVTVNGRNHKSFLYNQTMSILTIKNLTLSLDKEFDISWSFKENDDV